jgi:hypothetical protein
LPDDDCRQCSHFAIADIGQSKTAMIAAANKYIPGLSWRADSVVTGDFTCRGHRELAIENLNYDPKDEIGAALAGFQRSRVCKGLNIADNHKDSFHVYWNHESREFNWWSR